MGLSDPQKRPASSTTEKISPCAACAVRGMAFCGVLDEDEMPQLLSIMQTISVDSHGPIIDEGEPADYLFNLTEGAVKLYKLLPDGRRQITGFLFEGDFLGIAMNERYAYSAEAVGQVSLCRFPRRKLEGLLDAFPKLEKRLLGMASNELVQAQDQILLLGRKTAQEKIVSFLLNLSDRAVKRGASASPIAPTTIPCRCRAASSSGSPSPGRWCWSHRCFFSTNPCPISMPDCGVGCARKSATSRPASA